MTRTGCPRCKRSIAAGGASAPAALCDECREELLRRPPASRGPEPPRKAVLDDGRFHKR